MIIRRTQLVTEEQKRERIQQVMRLHKAGYAASIIQKRTGTEVGKAFKWAKELGITWTGKPVRQYTKSTEKEA